MRSRDHGWAPVGGVWMLWEDRVVGALGEGEGACVDNLE